jgi:hypothetical protein
VRRLLAVSLCAGTVLMGIGAAFHPMLHGDAAADMATIAVSPYFRAVHLAMLTGSALIMAGVWVRVVGGDDRRRGWLCAALVLVDIGLALNAYDIAFMAGAGLRLATTGGMPSLFDALHGIGLMYARFGNGIVALGAALLASAEWPARRLAAALAALTAVGGLVGVTAVDESSRLALAAVALLSAWSVVTAATALRFEA